MGVGHRVPLVRVDREFVFTAFANERRPIAILMDSLDDTQLANAQPVCRLGCQDRGRASRLPSSESFAYAAENFLAALCMGGQETVCGGTRACAVVEIAQSAELAKDDRAEEERDRLPAVYIAQLGP